MIASSASVSPDHGSPPRARGHGSVRRCQTWFIRFTPACAGTWEYLKCSEDPVHGSPPRARGHATAEPAWWGVDRFTPACAGTCGWSCCSTVARTVHPRVRGDMTGGCQHSIDRGGSPPRARGHATGAAGGCACKRFTPACAGTWWNRLPTCVHAPVHPRVRGDMASYLSAEASLHGSPPRARGHGQRQRCSRPRSRFTPACAGTWSVPLARNWSGAVHPRVRGDMAAVVSGGKVNIGSPPRARGHV